jgi:hypothetical protein
MSKVGEAGDRVRGVVAVAFFLTLGGSAGAAEGPVPPADLLFSDFFTAGASRLVPSAKLLGLNGRRVRLVGFMAEVESPLPGSFYLCPRPVVLAEEGAGTGDLPPVAVHVTVPGWEERVLPFVRRRLEVTGILDVGYREGRQGEVSWVRLTADPSSGSQGAVK